MAITVSRTQHCTGSTVCDREKLSDAGQSLRFDVGKSRWVGPTIRIFAMRIFIWFSGANHAVISTSKELAETDFEPKVGIRGENVLYRHKLS